MKQQKISFTGYRKYRLNVLAGEHADKRLSPPCGDCSACCRHYKSVTVQDYELNQDWLLADTPDENGKARLQKKADGSCIYLGDKGCTIYDRRPETCRMFDCRDFAITGIQPEGELGKASVRMAEKTLCAKRKDDWDFLAAARAAAFNFASSNSDHTVEKCAAAALYGADEFLDQAIRFGKLMDDMKANNPEEFMQAVEWLQKLQQSMAGKHLREIINHA